MHVGFGFRVLEFEAEAEILIVEDTYVCLRVVEESFDHSAWVHEIAVEEGGQMSRILEYFLVS